MSDIPGVKATTTVEVTDYIALGHFIAAANSEDQARFLCGMADALSDYEWALQLLSICQDAKRVGYHLRIEKFARLLALSLTDDEAATDE